VSSILASYKPKVLKNKHTFFKQENGILKFQRVVRKIIIITIIGKTALFEP
jgi:hypothetical protein